MSEDTVLKIVNLNKKFHKGTISLKDLGGRNKENDFWAIKDFNLEINDS